MDELNGALATVEGDVQTYQEQVHLANIRLGVLQELRGVTEQTLLQLLQVERLNLAQVQLEQQFLTQRQEGIDATVEARLERERLDIERQRNIATVALEQLNQIQTEDALETAIQNLQQELGTTPLEDIIDEAEWQSQLAELLTNLDQLQSQPSLPGEVQTLLEQTRQDIHE